MRIHIAESVQRSIHPLFGSGVHATFLQGLPELHDCAWQPRLRVFYQAVSHLSSTLLRCIITVFAVITVIIVLLQANSESAEFFKQCEIFYHKCFFFSYTAKLCACFFSMSVKLLLLQLQDLCIVTHEFQECQ